MSDSKASPEAICNLSLIATFDDNGVREALIKPQTLNLPKPLERFLREYLIDLSFSECLGIRCFDIRQHH